MIAKYILKYLANKVFLMLLLSSIGEGKVQSINSADRYMYPKLRRFTREGAGSL